MQNVRKKFALAALEHNGHKAFSGIWAAKLGIPIPCHTPSLMINTIALIIHLSHEQ
jgi:hypothetical protein